MMLTAVPLVLSVSGPAHVALLVREVLSHVNNKTVDDTMNIRSGRTRHHGALQIVAEAQDLLVLFVHRGHIHGERYIPFKISHIQV